jgi:hypothetical protein
MRNNSNIEEDMAYRGERPTGKRTQPSRSKTLMGRKLRVMTVEKGLLRETKAVQKMIDALVECRVRSLTLPLCFFVNANFSFAVLSRRSGRWTNDHRSTDARQRPTYPIPGRKRRSNQRSGYAIEGFAFFHRFLNSHILSRTLFRNVKNRRTVSPGYLSAFL